MQANAKLKQRGISLIAACLSMLAVGLLGAALLSTITAARHQRLYYDASHRAYYAAESGRSYAYARKSANPYYVPVGTFLLDSGEHFALSSVKVDTNLLVTSVGVAHGGTDRESHRSVTFWLDYLAAVSIDDVFLWAQEMSIRGVGSVEGPGGTIVITGDLVGADLRGGTDVAVSTIFVEGDAIMDAAGTVIVGSQTAPGNIYIRGDLDILGGTPTFYGNVHVKGNLRISHGRIHGNMYIHGDVQYVGGNFDLVGDSHIYYAGALVNWPSTGVHAGRAIPLVLEDMPPFPVIDETVVLRHPTWYPPRGYVGEGELQSNLRLYSSGDYAGGAHAAVANAVIVSEGDITITMRGQGTLVGVLVAPNGRVVFDGSVFEGVVIAGAGFYVGTGSPDVTFRSITEFFDNPDDYPFLIE